MKKGFTLIEVIITAALASVVLAIGSYVVITSAKFYKNEITHNKEMYYLNEALMYIESEVQNSEEVIYKEKEIVKILKITSIESNGNTLIIHKVDTKHGIVYKKEISLNRENKLAVTYYEKDDSKTVNNIAVNVESFTCSENGNLIYISIESKNGDKIERCIEVNILS